MSTILQAMPSIPADLTMSTVAAMVSQVYPSVEVQSVAPLAGGKINAVFEITCTKPPAKLVLKIYADTYHWKMEKEVFLYGLLADRPGVTVPTVLVTDASGALWPQNYTIMTKLDGVMLREAADAMSTEQLCSVYREMGLMLKQVHQVRFDAFGYVGTRVIEPKISNADYMQYQFDKKLDEFLGLGGDPLLDIAKTAIYPSQGKGPKLESLLEGYGEFPPDGNARLRMYQLYHSLELWDWMMARDPSTPWLPAIAEDIRRLAGSGE